RRRVVRLQIEFAQLSQTIVNIGRGAGATSHAQVDTGADIDRRDLTPLGVKEKVFGAQIHDEGMFARGGLLDLQNLLEDTLRRLECSLYQGIEGKEILGQSDRHAPELIFNFSHQRYPFGPFFYEHVVGLRKPIAEISLMADLLGISNQRR